MAARDKTAPARFDTLPVSKQELKSPGDVQEMEKALRAWMDSHGLLAITAAVLGVIGLLAVILVVGGFWLAR
jgi:hypothetical protein